MADEVGVPELFAGQSVFITGGTGFIGKVLIEKILRSCPAIEKVYVLTRERRGRTMCERLEDMAKLPLFDLLHAQRPGDFAAKVVAIAGDMTSEGLGISIEDRRTLIERVQFVYHVAAEVKFDQSLRDAILLNVRGTREMAQLALDMRHLRLFVHISTAFAHTQHNPIAERIYPAAADWQRCITAAERLPAFDLSLMQAHLLGGQPNNYTFTKALAERVIFDLLHGNVPNMIIRPTIIISSWRDPIPGWIDNFNGLAGMFVANGTGLVRINLVKDNKLDVLPVDITVRAFLNGAWYRITQMHEIEAKATSVHNCSSNDFIKETSLDVAKMALQLAEECVPSTCVWHLSSRRTDDPRIYNFLFICLHLIPAFFLDLGLRLMGYRPAVLAMHRRIFIAVSAVKYFMLNSWKIENDSLANIEAHLHAKDIPDFGYGAENIDVVDFFRQTMLGGMKYLMKEDMNKLESNRARFRILKQVDRVVTICFYGLLFHLFVLKWNLPGMMYNCLGNYLESLQIPLFFHT